jgi:hypothetical protein
VRRRRSKKIENGIENEIEIEGGSEAKLFLSEIYRKAKGIWTIKY